MFFKIFFLKMPNEFEFLINMGRLFQMSHPLSKFGRILFFYNLSVHILCGFLMRTVEIIILLFDLKKWLNVPGFFL